MQLRNVRLTDFLVLILFHSSENLSSSTSKPEVTYITDEGYKFLSEDITLQECNHSHEIIECLWVDPFQSKIVVKDEMRGWVKMPYQWESSASHGPYEISDGINHALMISSKSSQSLGTKMKVDHHNHDADEILDFPSFILSDPRNSDRASNIQKLLRSIGFSGNISLLPFTLATAVNIDQLLDSEIIDQNAIDRMHKSGWIGPRALTRYIANAMDHLNAIKMGLEYNFELFGIFEDDLMLAGASLTIRRRLNSALRRFPATADMLYLEACHERCSDRRFNYHYPDWARTSGPSCSAAIIFTKKGARRISQICRNVFWGIDNMYRAMIHAGLLEAYVITPTVFFQDGFWKSAMQPLRGGRKRGDRATPGVTHRPFSIMCNERLNELRYVHVQISEMTDYLRDHFSSSELALPLNQVKLMYLSDTLSKDPERNAEKSVITYLTKNQNDEWIEAGTWPQEIGAHGLILEISNSSTCFPFVETGVCMLRIKSSYASGGESIHDVNLSDLLFVHHRIDDENDVLIKSFSVLKSRSARVGNYFLPSLPSSTDIHKNNIDSSTTINYDKQVKVTGNFTSGQCAKSTRSLLTGVHFIFDGIMYMWYSGKMSGVNKMWYNIVPFMADVVHMLNGTFTHCQSSWQSEEGPKAIDLPRMRNLRGCENLTQVVASLPGDHKIVFSSYYRIANLTGNDRVCNILPLYDFIPERMGVYHKQHPAFYLKSAHIPLVSGFLSLSNSTTEDLEELHGVDSMFVSTSPNRASRIFRRIDSKNYVIFDDEFERSDELQAFLNLHKRFLLLIGYSKHSPEYKGYDIFWTALSSMPADFKSEMSLLVVGEMPDHPVDLAYLEYSPDVPESVLPILYSRASALISPSKYEGVGMPPIDALSCGCPVILGSFYEEKMQYVYGSDALYGGNVNQMKESLLKVFKGQVPSPDTLIARAVKYGSDPRFGWNEVAKDYLEYMIHGPFAETEASKCKELVSISCLQALQIKTTSDGIAVSTSLSDKESKNLSRLSKHEGKGDFISNNRISDNENQETASFTYLVKSDTMAQSSIPVCKGRCFAKQHSWPWLIPFASMPRSGTTFVRRVFEAATGVASEAEYEEGGSCQREVKLGGNSFYLYTDCIDDWATIMPDKKQNPACDLCDRGRQECSTSWCGCSLKNSSSEFPRFCKADASRDPILFKTHFPFRESKQHFFPFRDAVEISSFPGILITVRNPVTNYDAWRRFLSDERNTVEKTDFREFVMLWVRQYLFWRELAVEKKTVLLIVRYEDIMSQPHKTFENLLVNTGVINQSAASSNIIMHAVDFAINQHSILKITNPISSCQKIGHRNRFGIPEYSNTLKCGPNVEVEDLIWLKSNFDYLLEELVYDIELPVAQISTYTNYLRSWLGSLSDEETARNDKSWKIVLLSDNLLPSIYSQDTSTLELSYLVAGMEAGEWIQVGRWPGICGLGGTLLIFNRQCGCYDSLLDCNIMVQLLSNSSRIVHDDGVTYMIPLLSDLTLKVHDVDGAGDVLVHCANAGFAGTRAVVSSTNTP